MSSLRLKKCRWTGVAGNVLWRPPFHGQVKIKLLCFTALQNTFSVRGGSWFRTIKIRSAALWDGLICLLLHDQPMILKEILWEWSDFAISDIRGLLPNQKWKLQRCGSCHVKEMCGWHKHTSFAVVLKEEESDTSTFNLTATTADLNTLGQGWAVCSIWWCQSVWFACLPGETRLDTLIHLIHSWNLN